MEGSMEIGGKVAKKDFEWGSGQYIVKGHRQKLAT